MRYKLIIIFFYLSASHPISSFNSKTSLFTGAKKKRSAARVFVYLHRTLVPKNKNGSELIKSFWGGAAFRPEQITKTTSCFCKFPV